MNLLSLFTKQTKNGVRVYLPPEVDAVSIRYYYLHARDGALIPNSKIYADGALNYEINSLGCKGAEIDPSKPTIGIFGDSTTFCIGLDSWAQRIKIPGYQVLNAGVEGWSMDSVIDKSLDLSSRINLVGVVVYTGWHNIIYGETGEDYWRAQLDRLSNIPFVAHVNIATSLIEEAVERGIEELIERGSREKSTEYGHWGSVQLTHENIRLILNGVNRFNSFLDSYVAETGRHLLDLKKLLRIEEYDDIPKYFFDPGHMRVSFYPKIAQYMTEELLKLIPFNRQISRRISVDPGKVYSNESPQVALTVKDHQIRALETEIRALRESIAMHKSSYTEILKQLVIPESQ